ncbi:MAG: (Na+)-NQR maturation NqrM [Pseudomonadota bacterium]|nr:(Na+)-NQR maturation NqrM [Pseudomonadota bacterium]
MSTFILAFAFFLVMVSAMAIGYIMQKKSISGSCGGLGALGIDKACDCPEPCDRKKARMEKEQARQEKLKEWDKDRIL